MTVKNLPLRKCLGCGESKPKKELIRIVKTAEGDISLDETGRKNGRGAYVCRSTACIEKLKRIRGLDRSFQTAVSSETYDSLIREMKELADIK